MQFHAFDAQYLDQLRAGDFRTQEHFVRYFTELIHLKLRSRLNSPQAIEDVRQETFARVLSAIRKEGGLRQPERLGPFVNTVCNNVLLEHYRRTSRSESLDEAEKPELAAHGKSSLDLAEARQLEDQVRNILLEMPPRDRSLLRAVFLEDQDRDDVCRKFGVDADYLRVLLYRAKKVFKAAYLRRIGDHSPFASGAHEA